MIRTGRSKPFSSAVRAVLAVTSGMRSRLRLRNAPKLWMKFGHSRCRTVARVVGSLMKRPTCQKNSQRVCARSAAIALASGEFGLGEDPDRLGRVRGRHHAVEGVQQHECCDLVTMRERPVDPGGSRAVVGDGHDSTQAKAAHDRVELAGLLGERIGEGGVGAFAQRQPVDDEHGQHRKEGALPRRPRRSACADAGDGVRGLAGRVTM
jgi:hypothetical protein